MLGLDICAGECGRRGGYVEVVGVPEDVAAEMYKLASINLCSNVNGQICTAMVMNPPKVRLRLHTLSALYPKQNAANAENKCTMLTL